MGLEINAAMSNGSITKTGAGVLGIGGQSSAYTGATTINAGTLAFAANGAFIGNSAVTLAGGATIDARGLAGVIGSLAGSGTVLNYNLNTVGTLVTG